ncbi:uncharacterized protein LOC130662385 isoform X1 [Hydractinia symbiolongicarpus]|uniref:uncharacterized protein LOC130662385 isoform X1 n=1 Tax=Hydractinia symbiolongicarpus TaxID=13093 RepID=UPI002551C90B|nr:uncharacterized protein LOC130662385 isoform X1 [Hydractinia symbiolongicarpus]
MVCLVFKIHAKMRRNKVNLIGFCIIFMAMELSHSVYQSVTYPSIIWDPWNPLFACDVPKISVRLDDSINFNCPSKELQSFLQKGTTLSNVYENIYFIDTNKNMYDSCNATGGIMLLNCTYTNGDPSSKTLSFRQFSFPGMPTFTAGKTHYIIGTGFRTKENLANMVGGSCSKSGAKGEHKLRLEIYVCTEDDIKSGTCDSCKTTGCYYKGCGTVNCTNWSYLNGSNMIVDEFGDRCSRLLSRTCSNVLTSTSTVQYKKEQTTCGIVTGKKNCSQWFSTSGSYVDQSEKKCISIMQRTCVHPVFGNSTEFKSVEGKSCVFPTEGGLITGAKQTGKVGSSDKTLMYVVIAAVTSLTCGIIFGACGHHKLHSRNCNYKEKNGNKVLDGRTEKGDGFVNKGYRESVSAPGTDAPSIHYDTVQEKVGGVRSTFG